MALFGTPLAHEDHAGQACYATLAGQVIHDAQYSPEEYPEHTGY